MINRSYIWAVIIAFIVELASFIFLYQYMRSGYISWYWFNVYLLSISAICKSVFFFIVYKVQRFQPRFKVLSIASILTLYIYTLYFALMFTNGRTEFTTMLADITMITSVTTLIAAWYISVDPSELGFVKYPIIVGAVMMFLFKTPAILFTEFFVQQFFGYLHIGGFNLNFFILVFQYVCFGILTVFNVKIVKEIDFL